MFFCLFFTVPRERFSLGHIFCGESWRELFPSEATTPNWVEQVLIIVTQGSAPVRLPLTSSWVRALVVTKFSAFFRHWLRQEGQSYSRTARELCLALHDQATNPYIATYKILLRVISSCRERNYPYLPGGFMGTSFLLNLPSLISVRYGWCLQNMEGLLQSRQPF